MTAEQKPDINEESLKLTNKNTYKKPYQEFVRDDVIISQSIDPYQLILAASKHLLSQKGILSDINHKKTDKD